MKLSAKLLARLDRETKKRQEADPDAMVTRADVVRELLARGLDACDEREIALAARG